MSTIIASSIPKSASNEEIKKMFNFGDDGSANMEEITPLDSQHETKTVRIHYQTVDPVSKALLLNGTDFKGQTLRVIEETY